MLNCGRLPTTRYTDGQQPLSLLLLHGPDVGPAPRRSRPADGRLGGWPYPSVCSSFVWMTLKRQGITLESANAVVSPSDLEALDTLAGAQVIFAAPHGLYLYTAQERRAAADWLNRC